MWKQRSFDEQSGFTCSEDFVDLKAAMHEQQAGLYHTTARSDHSQTKAPLLARQSSSQQQQCHPPAADTASLPCLPLLHLTRVEPYVAARMGGTRP